MPNLIESSAPFLRYLEQWHASIPDASLDEFVGGEPERVAIICVDLIVGFCDEGPLSSPRVDLIVEPNVRLFEALHERGVKHFLLPQDAHDRDAIEFGAYPPHAIRGTHEADTVPELMALPFSNEFQIFEKNALSAFLETELLAWVDAHPEVDRYIAAGDCTDLCTYNLALHLRMHANARGHHRRVVLVEECVDTFDIPVDTAKQLGIRPHPGDFHHVVFLHHMEQNGVEIVRRLT